VCGARSATAHENLAEHPERSGRAVSATQSKGAERSSHKAASFDFVRHTTPDSAQDASRGILRTAAWIRGFSRSGGQSEKPAEASIPTNQQSIFRAGSQRARAFFSAARLSALADAAAPYDRRAIGRGLAISLVFNLLQIGWNVAIGRGLGLALPLTVYLAFVPLTAVALLLPAFGGLGVRELTYAGLFASAGVPQPTALALSLGVYLITVATGVVGGALYLVHGLRGVKAADRSGEADEYRG
jgi:hypothetical protein